MTIRSRSSGTPYRPSPAQRERGGLALRSRATPGEAGGGGLMTIFGPPLHELAPQLLLGLINGSFYAVLSLGLAVIFGMLNVINFAHGAQFMIGAFVAWIGLSVFGVNYWAALVLAPLVVAAGSVLIERLMLRRLYQLDHPYGLLLTFGLALIAEGVFRNYYGVSGESYDVPEQLEGGV